MTQKQPPSLQTVTEDMDEPRNDNNNDSNNVTHNTGITPHTQLYLHHLQKTRYHNHQFRKLTQKLKQISRNDNCPVLEPLSNEEIELITNTVKGSNSNLLLSPNLGKEFDDGHIEYKWKLIAPGPDRIQHLITQMTYRLGEGGGQCIYQMGIEDNGHPKGLPDIDLIESVKTVFLMAKQCNTIMNIESIKQGYQGKVATLSVIKNENMRRSHVSFEEEKKMLVNDVRLCVTGNQGVGKSTLIGVLTRGKLDDGNGCVRICHERHPHEIFNGRTSSLSRHLLGFDDNGTITNYQSFHSSHEYNSIVQNSAKFITFVDHPGHERYFKTMVLGLTSTRPHYVMLTVSLDEFEHKKQNDFSISNNKSNELSQLLTFNLDGLLDGLLDGNDDDDSSDTDLESSSSCNSINNDMRLPLQETISAQTSITNDPSIDYQKYLAMCESMNVPLFIVITKSDLDQFHKYTRLPKMLDKISNVITQKSHNKMKIKLIESSSEASRAARALASSVTPYIPVFVCSCINGEGLDYIKTFLFSLPSNDRDLIENSVYNDAVIFGVDKVYDVTDVDGIVVAGILRRGVVKVNDKYLIGPDKNGEYEKVSIESIQVRRKDCSFAFQGQLASLLLKGISNRNKLRRGMVIIDGDKIDYNANTCYSFEAHIDVLFNCTLRENSQPIIHIENIRQSAHILQLHNNSIKKCPDDGGGNGSDDSSTDVLHTNGVGVFSFLHRPEFVKVGSKIIIRKSHGPIALGRVTKILDSVRKPLVPKRSLTFPKRKRVGMRSKNGLSHYLKKWKLEKQRNECKEKDGGGGGCGGDGDNAKKNVEYSSASVFSSSEEDDERRGNARVIVDDVNQRQRPIRKSNKNKRKKWMRMDQSFLSFTF